MNETEFHQAVEAVLARIESAVEASEALEADLESGILTVTCPDESRVIVNRQTPNREIWVAARSGGFHLRWKDIQQSIYLPSCGFAFTTNLGEAESYGFDLEGEARLTETLSLNLAVGYVRAEYASRSALSDVRLTAK